MLKEKLNKIKKNLTWIRYTGGVVNKWEVTTNGQAGRKGQTAINEDLEVAVDEIINK